MVGADRRFEFAKCYKVILDGGDFELSRRRGALRSRGRKQQLYALNCSDGCVSERGLIRRVLIKDSYNTGKLTKDSPTQWTVLCVKRLLTVQKVLAKSY